MKNFNQSTFIQQKKLLLLLLLLLHPPCPQLNSGLTPEVQAEYQYSRSWRKEGGGEEADLLGSESLSSELSRLENQASQI